MKKIVIHSGFYPDVQRTYKGEHIYKVIKVRSNGESRDFHTGSVKSSKAFYGLDHGGWITDLGDEKYITDWTAEERWGRVEEVETDEQGKVLSTQDLGFMILRVDRSKGML